MLEQLRKKAEEFAIEDASQKVVNKVMDAIKPYVTGEMKKQEAEFARMAKYINGVEDKVIALEKKVSELEKGKKAENKL